MGKGECRLSGRTTRDHTERGHWACQGFDCENDLVRRSSWDRWMRNHSVVPDVKWILFISGSLRLLRDTTPTQERPKKKKKRRSSLMEIDHQPFFSPIFSPRSQSPSSFRPNVFSLLFKFKQVHFFVYRQPFHFPVQLSPLSQVLLSYPSEQLPLLSIALLVQVAPPSLLSFVLLGVCLLRTNDSFLFFLFLFFFPIF